MKQGYLIFNPIAGGSSKTRSVVATVLRQFERQGIDLTPAPTEPDGIVLRQVSELVNEKPDLLVAWGGDGTIHEVVNGMFGSDIPLGVIPGGTANVYAKELKLPGHPSDAIRLIARGKTRKISVGQVNHRFFVLMAGIGFDSEVIRNVEWNMKRRYGKLAFAVAAFDTARKYLYPKFTVRCDGQETECVFAVVCNAREYAAYFALTPNANISDEYLHVCLFKEAGLGSMMSYMVHALKRTHIHLDSVELFRCQTVEIDGTSDIAVQADGELIGFLPAKLQIHPASLNVFCP